MLCEVDGGRCSGRCSSSFTGSWNDVFIFMGASPRPSRDIFLRHSPQISCTHTYTGRDWHRKASDRGAVWELPCEPTELTQASLEASQRVVWCPRMRWTGHTDVAVLQEKPSMTFSFLIDLCSWELDPKRNPLSSAHDPSSTGGSSSSSKNPKNTRAPPPGTPIQT